MVSVASGRAIIGAGDGRGFLACKRERYTAGMPPMPRETNAARAAARARANRLALASAGDDAQRDEMHMRQTLACAQLVGGVEAPTADRPSRRAR